MRRREEGIPPAEYRRRVIQRAQEATDRRATEYAVALQRSLHRVLLRTGTGRTYTYRGRTYRASAPGQPPAMRTRYLGESAYTTVRPARATSETHWTAGVGITYPAPYAAALDPTTIGEQPTGRAGEREINRFVLADAEPELRRIQRSTRA
jgi:hypothetical protein